MLWENYDYYALLHHKTTKHLHCLQDFVATAAWSVEKMIDFMQQDGAQAIWHHIAQKIKTAW